MNDQALAALVGGIAGLATGVVGSLLAPWVNWGIEKRRHRYQRRCDLINQWRAGLATAEADGSLHNVYQRLEWYQSLSPHLASTARAKARRRKLLRQKPEPRSTPPSRTTVVMPQGGGRLGTAVMLDYQIQRLAKKWRIE